MEKKSVLIIAGEASGDLHAANLVSAIRSIYPQVNFSGLGGQKLKEQGVHIYYDIVELAVVGFFEVLKNLEKFRKIFKDLLARIDKSRPDLAILVDYPGFNLRLAEELHKRGIPIIYYISPQVWAWGAKRIESIKRLVERIIVVFKFEEELYKKHGVPVSFVGHPLLDIVKPKISKEEFLASRGVASGTFTIALLPGSREKEVMTHLPIMLDSAGIIHKNLKNTHFFILRSTSVKENIFNKIISRYKLPASLVCGSTYDGLAASDFALVASGTATLETAILKIPMAIIYKVSLLTWLYVRTIIKIPYIGLVNVIKQEKIIPEFIQYGAMPEKIACYVIDTLNSPEKLKKIKESLSSLEGLLGENGASLKAGRIVADFLTE